MVVALTFSFNKNTKKIYYNKKLSKLSMDSMYLANLTIKRNIDWRYKYFFTSSKFIKNTFSVDYSILIEKRLQTTNIVS